MKYSPPPELPAGLATTVRVDTGVFEGGEISMYYDPMIAKLIVHGATRDQAIARMRDALNAFVIRGVSTNIAFQSALMQNPRFVSGNFNTGLIAEEYPQGFNASDVPHDDPAMQIVVAAAIHRSYLERNASISGQMPGHEYVPGDDFVVLLHDEQHAVVATPVAGGCQVVYGGECFAVKSRWQFGQALYQGTINNEPFCMQVERIGLRYRLHHWGTQADVMVLTAHAAALQALMPKKAAPDLSRFLLSPMPGLLTEISVVAGQEVKAGEKLAVIEAMKMENVLKADQDCVVAKVLAKPGESLAVDQAIIEFRQPG